jgi:hypothetical protein
VLSALARRKLNELMAAMGSLAALSGVLLYILRFPAGSPWNAERVVLTLGSLGGLHAYAKGILVSRPLAERLGRLAGQLGPGQPDAAVLAELKEVQAKLSKAGRSSGYELLAVLLLMAGHRLAALF